ncbi:glycosyltransferase family 2 protein [Ruicaihuangia caeni]|uniref:glycosyltransferase family 2 protein n=1 Tax=Ruicaihuangia caeni TaxID=3042517 RepID=UPI00338ED6AB
MIDCSIIVVSYRSADDLAALIDSVPEAVGALSWELIVVDNVPDGDSSLDEIVLGRSAVQLVRAGANLGYSGGINRGLAAATASRYTVILNPDLTLEPGSIERLARACELDGVAASVPLILDDHGVPQPSLRREPSLLGSLGEALFGDHWSQRPAALTEMVRDARAYQQARDIEWATGAALMMRADVAERVGDWDADRFFLYSEETDYCRRIRATEGTVRFEPSAVVRHRGSGSGSSPQLDALREVNRLRYFAKWHDDSAGRLSTALFAGVLLLHHALRAHRPDSRAALLALVSRSHRAALPGGRR